MNLLQTNFVDQGIPVIIGEYGCPKNNKAEESVRLFLSSVCEAAYSRDMCPILWDITDLHYDRTACEMTDSTLLQLFHAIIGIDDVNSDGAEATTESSTAATDTDVTWGDANVDGIIDISDAVSILSYVSNVSKYPLTEQGLANADVNQNGDGISNSDALAVQRYISAVLSELPESYN